jgi:hypothetical protein
VGPILFNANGADRVDYRGVAEIVDVVVEG